MRVISSDYELIMVTFVIWVVKKFVKFEPKLSGGSKSFSEEKILCGIEDEEI